MRVGKESKEENEEEEKEDKNLFSKFYQRFIFAYNRCSEISSLNTRSTYKLGRFGSADAHDFRKTYFSLKRDDSSVRGG